MKANKISKEIAQSDETMLSLKRVIGFTGKTCPDLKIVESRVYFASGKILISANVP
jgi:hypothetical protein